MSINLHSNFIEITTRQLCSPVHLLDMFKTRFPKNTSDSCFYVFKKFMIMFEINFYDELHHVSATFHKQTEAHSATSYFWLLK